MLLFTSLSLSCVRFETVWGLFRKRFRKFSDPGAPGLAQWLVVVVAVVGGGGEVVAVVAVVVVVVVVAVVSIN